jgi:hypothetical protein
VLTDRYPTADDLEQEALLLFQSAEGTLDQIDEEGMAAVYDRVVARATGIAQLAMAKREAEVLAYIKKRDEAEAGSITMVPKAKVLHALEAIFILAGTRQDLVEIHLEAQRLASGAIEALR